MVTFRQYWKTVPTAMHCVTLLTAAALAVPLAGFGCGVWTCKDCGTNPLAYLFMGCIHAVLSLFGPTVCVTSFASKEGNINMLPYIALIIAALYLTVMVVGHRLALRSARLKAA
jgi:hypothetical protein